MRNSQDNTTVSQDRGGRVGVWGAILAGGALIFGGRNWSGDLEGHKEAELSSQDCSLPAASPGSEGSLVYNLTEPNVHRVEAVEISMASDLSSVTLTPIPFSLPINLISLDGRKVNDGSLSLSFGSGSCSLSFKEGKPIEFTAKMLQSASLEIDVPTVGYLNVRAYGFLPLEKFPCHIHPGLNDSMNVLLNPGLIVYGEVLEAGTGTPVSNAFVMAEGPGGGLPSLGLTSAAGEVVGQSGENGLSGIDPNWPTFTLSIHAKGFSNYERSIVANTPSFTAYLERGSTFKFTLIDSNTNLSIAPLQGKVEHLDRQGDGRLYESYNEENGDLFEIKNVKIENISAFVIRESGYAPYKVILEALHSNSQNSMPNRIVLSPAVGLCSIRLIDRRDNTPFSGAYYVYTAVSEDGSGQVERKDIFGSFVEDQNTPGRYRLGSDCEDLSFNLKEIWINEICSGNSSDSGMKVGTANGALSLPLLVWNSRAGVVVPDDLTFWVDPTSTANEHDKR